MSPLFDSAPQAFECVAKSAMQPSGGCVERNASTFSANGGCHANDVVWVNSVGCGKGIAEQPQVAAIAVSANETMKNEFPRAVGQQDGIGANIIGANGANVDRFAVANNRVHALTASVEADRRVLLQQRDGDLTVRLWMGLGTHRQEF